MSTAGWITPLLFHMLSFGPKPGNSAFPGTFPQLPQSLYLLLYHIYCYLVRWERYADA